MHPTPRIERPAPSRTGAACLAAPASSDAGRAPVYAVTWTEGGEERIVMCSTGNAALKQKSFQMMRGQLPTITSSIWRNVA